MGTSTDRTGRPAASHRKAGYPDTISREPRRAGLRALLLVVVATALMAVPVLVPVPAVAASPIPAPDAPGPGPEFAPTMVVLDASGSMTGPDPSGGTKVQAAQQAVHTMIGSSTTSTG